MEHGCGNSLAISFLFTVKTFNVIIKNNYLGGFMKTTIRYSSELLPAEVEYDETKFDICAIPGDEKIAIKRLSDGVVLKILEGVGFIVQNKIYGQYNFVVSDYSKNLQDDRNEEELFHFVTNDYSDRLKLKNKFNVEGAWLYQIRIMDNLYLIKSHLDHEVYLYNMKDISQYYDDIYCDKELIEQFDGKVIFVKKEFYAYNNDEINDTLTYGINPETYEIVTSIWSDLQQRFIDIYTDEQKNELDEKMKANNYIGLRKDFSNADITIEYEVKKYLNLISKYIEPSLGIYKSHNEINQEFVKKMIRK